MNKYRYNEKLLAEKMIKSGFQSKYYFYELKVLVKYYKSQDIKAAQRKKMIYEFCEKYIEEFNPVLYFRKINSVLKYASKKENKLIVVEEIQVTDKEFKYIDQLDLEHNLKKILFTMMVINKVKHYIYQVRYNRENDYNYFGGNKKAFRELIETSKVPSSYKIDKVMYNFTCENYIEPKDKSKVKMCFVEKIELSDNNVMVIKSFDNIGYYYDLHCGIKNVISCECCGDVVKVTGKNHRMCRDCWKEREKELWRKSKRKTRNVQVL